MTDSDPIMIVGAGIAGVHAAESLRQEGYEGRIVLVDRDTNMPYDRPPLSKEWMLGEIDDGAIFLRDSSFYEKLEIEWVPGVDIVTVDPIQKRVETKSGEKRPWSKLLLATGSNLRKLTIEGDDLEGIFYLRTLDDARVIRESLKDVQQAVVVGAGFIGAELASSLQQSGVDVTIVEMAPYPMENIVGRQVSKFFLDLHRSHDVEVITEDAVARFRGNAAVEEAVTVKGRHIPCQMVIIGVGVLPNTAVSHPQLQVHQGYVVNEYGETSLPDIYAAGDCTSWPYNRTYIHVEHWDHAVNHGKNVAKNMIQPQSAPYTYIPYFWSDQYGHRFQYVGHTKPESEIILRGSREANEFTAFYLDDRQVIEAAFIVNQTKNTLPVRRMIKSQKSPDPEVLSDHHFSLKQIEKGSY